MATSKRIPRARRAFTLMEILLAVTIFAIAMSALFVTFRTGIRAWRAGHGGAELFQTARVAQDVILSDLNNVAFLSEFDYNNTFRNQIPAYLAGLREEEIDADGTSPAERREERRKLREERRAKREKGEQVEEADDRLTESDLPRLQLEDITVPVDLSFQVSDGGLLDELSFARHRRPRSSDDTAGTGHTRVRYFVKDGVLFREESSTVGFKPGEDTALLFKLEQERGAVASLFSRGGGGGDDAALLAAGGESAAGGEAGSLLPETPKYAEPLCRGVEIFDVSLGYFRAEGWNEAPDWASSSYKYRFPSEDYGFGADGADIGAFGPGMTDTRFTPGGMRPSQQALIRRPEGQRSRRRSASQTAMGLPAGVDPNLRPSNDDPAGEFIQFQPEPDGLPGYVAIQLGLRDPRNEGRLRSFTFVVSLPMAREVFDTTQIEDTDRPGMAKRSRTPPPPTEKRKLFN